MCNRDGTKTIKFNDPYFPDIDYVEEVDCYCSQCESGAWKNEKNNI